MWSQPCDERYWCHNVWKLSSSEDKSGAIYKVHGMNQMQDNEEASSQSGFHYQSEICHLKYIIWREYWLKMTNTQQLVGFGPANVKVLDLTGKKQSSHWPDILQDLCMIIHRSDQHFSVAFPKGKKVRFLLFRILLWINNWKCSSLAYLKFISNKVYSNVKLTMVCLSSHHRLNLTTFTFYWESSDKTSCIKIN